MNETPNREARRARARWIRRELVKQGSNPRTPYTRTMSRAFRGVVSRPEREALIAVREKAPVKVYRHPRARAIIRLAREIGWRVDENGNFFEPGRWRTP